MSTDADQLLSNLHPPFFPHRRTPGPWSWDDFRPGVPRNSQEYRGDPETTDVRGEHRFRKSLLTGWTRDGEKYPGQVLHSLPTKGSIYQINARTTGAFDIYRRTEILKQRLSGQEDHLGTYLFVDLSESLLLKLGVKYNMDIDFFRTCLDLSVSHSVSTENPNHIRISLPFLFSGEKVAGTMSLSHLSFHMLGIYMMRTRDDCSILVWYPPVKKLPGLLVETYNWMAQMSLERQWKDTNRETRDSAFLIFPILWWVVYAWYDAIDDVRTYFNWLEDQVLKSPSIKLTQQIHTIRGCLFNYKSLLEEFIRTVDFIETRLHPGRNVSSVDPVGPMTVINTHGDSYFHYCDRTRPETRPASRLYGISHEFSRTAEDEGTGRFEVVDDPSLETPVLASAPQPNAEAPPPSVTSEIRQEGTIHADSANLVSTPRDTDAATSTQEDSLKQPKDQQFERCCREIKAEIVRLQGRLDRRDERMKDVMIMVFSHVTIRDSTSMKQIAWVTMVYIPPTFVAGVFGMNVTGVGAGVTTLIEYVWTAFAFTVPTVWILGMLSEGMFEDNRLKRFFWPIFRLLQTIQNSKWFSG
ncbi:hypothetical protein DFH08DRAFT_809292 [Mycena albidolilacea]|uniref:Uncharacterized protein n=1 Tax=Mycena albidolilacea TaxID=1033008 RepID=A0AAD7ER36_9AGAR|nr:hypothetical protein DFH08DRAFT_809292 [Mycena albidolilacea]